jgi:hypothetical protein
MQPSAGVQRVVVVGQEAAAVGRAVSTLRGPGVAVAGFVGRDEQAARLMAEEMLGGVERVVRLFGEDGRTAPGAPADA